MLTRVSRKRTNPGLDGSLPKILLLLFSKYSKEVQQFCLSWWVVWITW